MIIDEIKVTVIFCVIDEFNKNFDNELSKHALIFSCKIQKRSTKISGDK
jgi:hypothetical protein